MPAAGQQAGNSQSSYDALVIGAGMIGVSTALHLQRRGLRVALVDRLEPGEGASFGNGAILAASSVVPVTTPGLLKRAPGMLLDKDGALFLRWSYLPKMLPWLKDYLSNCDPARVSHIARHLYPLIGDSLDEHRALSNGSKASKWVQPSRYLFIYRNRAAFDGDAYGWNLRRDLGISWEVHEGPAARELEPDINPAYQCFVALEDQHGFIGLPDRYIKDLAESFQELGGQYYREEVTGFDLEEGQICGVSTKGGASGGKLSARQVVLAAGAWSARLLKPLGINIPLESERGYHVQLSNPSAKIRHPLMIADGKFVATPLEPGLRLAGLVEFGGLEAAPSKAPVQTLLRRAQQVFPGLTYDSCSEWMGHRPAPSDSLPVLGPTRRYPNLHLAFGHHHVGLTSGPKTGRLIAEAMTGQDRDFDFSPYRAERF
ncbi:NAD(P)/FAD-dependent oxidoreductase [Rhodovibrionaceae bacterium A322]